MILSTHINQIYADSSLSFSGNSLHAIDIIPEKNTGLDHIYVLYTIDGVYASFQASSVQSAYRVKWFKYTNLGGSFAEELTDISVDGDKSILTKLEGNTGYIVEEGDSRSYFWVVDYQPQHFSLKNINLSDQSDCDYTRLDVDCNASPIHYFTINGQQRILSREIEVAYENQQWDESTKEFNNYTVKKILDSIDKTISLTPPIYCSTFFTISGDRFLKEWNWDQEMQSNVMDPIAVDVRAEAKQENDSAADGDSSSNEIKGNDSGLGGSAPAHILFHAYTTQGVIHNEWQMSRDFQFEDIEYRFNERELDYTFNEEGTFYLRYIGSNSDGSCEAYSDVFTVNIGASELKCPNAFSPDGDGVNDEWMVSYRSIIDFDCWIFDRYGHQIIHLDSPDKGWDGKRGGKLVGPGVYYYVIKARGADGKEYKKSGDINIIRHVIRGAQGASPASKE
ncbi:MAG: gliding motility-associated C-terminal domain-containing protein [Muribaculaceae bacterium]|nr:gliding motility-associated C-terminal domain-containing protein [Muribaculaceae bacterium]